MKVRLAKAALAASVSLALTPAHALLERMGPLNNSPTVGGFPSWFQDQSGIALEFCDPQSQAELDGGWCVLLPGDATIPESFPGNFFDEHFYYRADAQQTVGTTRARLVLAVEAAFANGPAVPGDGITFGRIRVQITSVPFSGTYTVYHPYGKWIFPDVAAGDRIFFTQDVGVSCVGTFECTLGTDIGPYVLPSEVPGGNEVPPVPELLPGQDAYYDLLLNTGAATAYPANGKRYIADPSRLGPVTGSPLPAFAGNDGVTYNHNTFRVEGPNGFVAQTNDFTMAGRLFTGAMPGQVSVDRASYAQVVGSTTGKKLDVFATGQATSQGRTPGLPRPDAVVPSLTFYEAPCTGSVNPDTGAILPPYGPPAGVAPTVMASEGTKYWGQAHPAAIPPSVCVKDSTSTNAAGQVVPTYYLKKVTDETTTLSGSGATYDPADGGTLSIAAKSTDTLNAPVLTVQGFGDMVNGLLTVTPLAAPPSKVTVMSSEGSSVDMIVQTAVGSAGNSLVPLALNDEFAMNEDCSPDPAAGCATPLVLDPLANDTIDGKPLPAGTVLTITAAPRNGIAVVNADNTITYTPNANMNGAEGISYKVTVNGMVSNVASITVNIAPVNDPPVAVNDAADAVVGQANAMNVIGNDTDIDGNADVKNAQIVTWPPQLGPQPVPTTGVVTFTPAASGTFSYTYRAVDAAGALSGNVATATVNVGVAEAITFTSSLFRTGASRWRVDGADSVRQGQTLTLAYANGTLNAANGGGTCNGTAAIPGCVIATAVVDALGNWSIDKIVPTTSPSNPTSSAWATKPTQITIFSSSPVLGGSRTTAITLKN